MQDSDLIRAYKFSFNNRESVLKSDTCGCYYCCYVFEPAEITNWIDKVDDIGQTALCPLCEGNSVIGSASGFSITKIFLWDMYIRWSGSFERLGKSLPSPAETKIQALLKMLRTYHVYTSTNPIAIFGIDLAPIPWLKYQKHPQVVLSPVLPISNIKGFSIHCTPQENPGGEVWDRLHQKGGYWERETKLASAFNRAKPSSSLAECTWVLSENDDDIIALTVRTAAYALYNDGLVNEKTKKNRSEDIAWAKHKIEWLWKEALPEVQLPKIKKIKLIEPDEHFDIYDIMDVS